MDTRVFKVLQLNRVKLLSLDYFDLTAPLLSKEVLPTWKHKEIKTEGKSDKARIDGLLDWLEECTSDKAFQVFVEGVRNCKQGNFAKRLKKEAEQNVNGPITLSSISSGEPSTSTSAAALGTTKTTKDKSANGLKKTPLPNEKIVNKKSTPRPKNIPKITGDVKAEVNSEQSAKKPKIKKPRPPPPVFDTSILKKDDDKKAKSSTSTPKPKPSVKRESPPDKDSKIAKVTLPKTLQGSPFKTNKRKITKLEKAMTFEEVEAKQKNARQRFKFSNNAAVLKEICPGDLFYEGCSHKGVNGMCSKKVWQLDNKEYFCNEDHKTESPFLFPRVEANFTDGTADLQLTLFKQNVEALLSVSHPDLLKMDSSSLKSTYDSVINKNFHIEVDCTKLDKREMKKFGGKRWNNVATILDEEPQAKMARKSSK